MGAPGPNWVDRSFDRVVLVDTVEFDVNGFMDKDVAVFESIRVLNRNIPAGPNLSGYLSDDVMCELAREFGAEGGWDFSCPQGGSR